MREKYLVGNWKMNQTVGEIEQFFKEFDEALPPVVRCHLWLAPQGIHIERVFADPEGTFEVGAQNCSEHKSGAYTGEISPLALKDMGATFVILGHSERRQYFGENSDGLKKKVSAAIDCGLHVVFCVGESLSQREGGLTEEVVAAQLREVLAGFPVEEQERLLIAYEPVWAIGTGQSAGPEQAQEVHAYIRLVLNSLKFGGEDIALLYGGSVKPDNIADLLSQPDIDGALVGGASLDGKSFARMAQAFG